jgi:hypothetical protein
MSNQIESEGPYRNRKNPEIDPTSACHAISRQRQRIDRFRVPLDEPEAILRHSHSATATTSATTR